MNRFLSPAVCAAEFLAAVVSCASSHPVPTTTAGLMVRGAVPGGTAVSSLRHGPFRHGGNRAFGFTQDEVGEAIAATPIGPRISSGAGAALVDATFSSRCWDHVAVARERFTTALPGLDQPARAYPAPVAIYFRVSAGDGRGEHNVMFLLADTSQARDRRGYTRVDATLRWELGDWRLRVPLPQARPHPDTTGYALLGPTP